MQQLLVLTVKNFGFNNTENASFHDFSIVINTTNLLRGKITDPVTNPNYDAAYRIDPRWDKIVITIEDLDQRYPLGPLESLRLWLFQTDINLTKVTFSQTRYGFARTVPHSRAAISKFHLR